MGFWDVESIAAEQRAETEARLADASREDLLAEIVALRTAAYPFLATFSGLDMPAPRGVSIASKLFPQPAGTGRDRARLAVADPVTGVLAHVDPDPARLHDLDYLEADSLVVLNPASGPPALHDDACVLSVRWEGIGGGGVSGAIEMGDARRLASAMGHGPRGRTPSL